MRNASSEWTRLQGRRRGLEKRWEKYASFTLPRLYTDERWDEDTDELAMIGRALAHRRSTMW